MTMDAKSIAPAGHLDEWRWYRGLIQPGKRSRNKHGRGGVDKAGKKWSRLCCAYQAVHPGNSRNRVFSFFSASGLPKKGLAEQDCRRGCALEGLAMTREVDQVKPSQNKIA